jgi:endonuclease III
MARKTEAERLSELEAKKSALEAQMQAIQARQKSRAKKKDDRRKIILGALLLSKAAEDERFARVVEQLLKAIQRPADLSAFTDWEPPNPKFKAQDDTLQG